jgi:UDP-sugar pyrophosphorylase
VLIFEITPYYKALNRTKGLMPEFVNPKYANAEKTVFKSPTRLECLMQDFPKLLTDNEKVGFCMYEKWFCFSTCKNNLKDGCDKLKKGLSAETAFSEEQDIYYWNIKVLKEILGKLTIDTTEPDETLQIEGTEVKFGPKIILEPSFAVTVSELKQKVKGNWKIFNNSALVVRNDIKIERDLTLNGYLTIENDQVDNLVCENKQRMKFVLLKPGEGENYEQIRGYTVTLVLDNNNKI